MQHKGMLELSSCGAELAKTRKEPNTNSSLKMPEVVCDQKSGLYPKCWRVAII